MQLPLKGIIPPLVTPLAARDQLDAAGFENLIEHVLRGGCSGLFVLGSTGEAPALSYALRLEVIRRFWPKQRPWEGRSRMRAWVWFMAARV